jgi:small-conductance mechanosensitive channel
MNEATEQAEALKGNTEIKRELEKTGTKEDKPKLDAKERIRFGTYILILLLFAAVFYLARFDYFSFAGDYVPLLQRFATGAAAITLLMLLLRAAKVYLIRPLDDAAARYNLTRVANLLAGVAIFFIAVSILFANWYTAVVSLGLISLVLGFALQTPITSFIGWIYILVGAPYRVGDRIMIGNSAGDVIAVGYFDTTLWEVGGPTLSTANHPSGRIIKFPNSNVLSSAVYNYSWSLFPYIWNDISFQVAYQSDLEFVANTMRNTADEEVGTKMRERIRVYRELLKQTPVDELEVKEHPVVVFRVDENTWITAIVRYLVEPRLAGSVKTRLIKKMLDRLNAEPEKVMFPQGNAR